MAVDVCSENSSLVASPRISFSHDLSQADGAEFECRRSDALLLDSSAIDFDFCVGSGLVQEISSADELFSNGKIIPSDIKKVEKMGRSALPNLVPRPQPYMSATFSCGTSRTAFIKQENGNGDTTKKKRLKEFLLSSYDPEEEKPVSSKSFWQFRRSSSLNCDDSQSKYIIRSLQLLSRSNSTGSALNPKQKTPAKVIQKRQSFTCPLAPPPLSSSTVYYSYNSSSMPPLMKNCRSYSNGVRVSPVLNVPPAYISKVTVSLFGFGSFCYGKAKKKKK